ncbi:MAG TPA: hypothetical protein VF303_02945, partial [Candidatus Nanoarchaeia archaeon]
MKFFSAKNILIITIIIIAAIASVFYWHRSRSSLTDKAFLSNLKGEIVYTFREKDGVSNVYKISANGVGKKLIYHNEDKTNSNSFLPVWSE